MSARIAEENFSKESGFKVPDGYFDNLETKILTTAIPSEKRGKTISLFSKKNYRYAAAIAASVIIGIFLFNPNKDDSTLDSIQLSMIDTYIEEGNLNMDLYELISHFELEEIHFEDIENLYIPQMTLETYLLEYSEEEILMNISPETGAVQD